MTAIPVAVIDACVLVNFSLCDTLLRLAEPPRIYEPKWSEEILTETLRTLEGKLGWPVSLTQYFQSELKNHFAEAWVSGDEPLIPYLKDEEKDLTCWQLRFIRMPDFWSLSIYGILDLSIFKFGKFRPSTRIVFFQRCTGRDLSLWLRN